MERVYNQVKRIIDNVNFDKIYKGFVKKKIVLKINGIAYCNDKSILNNQISNNDYVTYEISSKEISIKDIVIELIVKMFELQFDVNPCNQERLKFLLMKKSSEFYELKYQLNLVMVNILKGNTELTSSYLAILNEIKKEESIYLLEEQIEKNIGLKKYIKLKLLEMFKPDDYHFKLRFLIDTLEDPTKLVNYINYAEDFSVAYLLVNSQIKEVSVNQGLASIEKPLFSFSKLILQKDKQTKKLLMHKMINAKKSYLKGKIIDIDFNNVYACDNLLYLPNEITILYNNKKVVKKGEFLLQLNDSLEIIEGYECFSIEKILV